jgi:PAS domain-containing protein
MFEREIADERSSLVRRLQAEIRNAFPDRSAAQRLADSMRSFFSWDHLAIASIQLEQGGMVGVQPLVESCSLPDLHSNADARIRESLVRAMLREYRTDARTAIVVDDTAHDVRVASEAAANARFRSTLTFPIWFNGACRWVLQIGVVVPNAFHGPDIQVLEELVSKLEHELERAYRSKLNSILLERMPQGVIVVDTDGRVLEANRAATERILGWDLPPGTRLEDYAATEDTRDVLSGKVADTSRRVELKTAFNRLSVALATRHDLPEAFQSSVWFLTDMDDLDWNVEYRYLREIVHDVAQQTRGPLILASTTMQRALRQMTDPDAAKACEAAVEKLLSEIGKADITFERLAEGLSAIKEPMRERGPVDLNRTLEGFITALPERDRRHIDLVPSPIGPVVMGDAVRIRFVLRSIVGHLLRCRPDDDHHVARIRVATTSVSGLVTISLCITGMILADDSGPVPEKDPLWTWMQYARDDASLALEAVEKVLASHGASLSKSRLQTDATAAIPVWAKFDIQFPLEA